MPEKTRNDPKAPEPAQIDKFREAARELGCDESEEGFRAAVRKVAKAPPSPKGARVKKQAPAK